MRRGIPPVLLVLTATTSVQIGSSLAKGLFVETPPQVAAWLRILFAALFLSAVFRPTLRGRSREQWLSAVGYGVALTGMSTIFYLSIQRIPVGMAVTFEFLGPLTVAAFGSKRRRDLIWVALFLGSARPRWNPWAWSWLYWPGPAGAPTSYSPPPSVPVGRASLD